MWKSLLLRFPAAYERVQQLRDWRWLKIATAAGSYAQHSEDVELLRLLNLLDARGPFLDVGCNHPFKLSNTFLLYERGWRGVCVDPLPRFEELFGRWRPGDQFVNVAIGDRAGELVLHEFESDVLSTIDPALATDYRSRGYRLRKTSPVVIARLDEVLQSAGVIGPLSLLSIDIEGHELPALRSIDLDHWKPALICLEVATLDGERKHDALTFAIERGYEIALDLGMNVVLQRLDESSRRSFAS